MRLEDFDGRAVIVFFWVSSDHPSQRQLPVLIELQKENDAKVFQVLGIALDTGSPKELATFAEQHQLNFPILRFNLKVVQDFGGLQFIPTLFVLDKNHNIIEHYVGWVEKNTLEQDLKAILK